MSKNEAVRPHYAEPSQDLTTSPLPSRRLAVVALVLAALNLRPAVTSLGPVLEEVRSALGMSGTVAGLLTSLPEVCFALVGFAAPRLARRYGADGVIGLGAVALTLGLLARPFSSGTVVFIALSAVALAGIAVTNVLLPVVVKQRFPDRVGAMTGVYSMALNVGACAAAAGTVPLARAFGGRWEAGLGSWTVLAALAVPAWLVLGRRRGAPLAAAPGGAAGAPGDVPDVRITRSPTAWALAVFFGLQAGGAYVIIGWLPQMFRDAGLSAEAAGLLFAVTSLLSVPLSYPLSALAGRLRSQSGLAAGLALCGLAGFAGLWAAPAGAPWLWAVLLGLSNTAFPLALAMIGMRGRDGATVTRLSAFAQSTGYLISIPVPILVGVLYQHSGGWRTPLVLMAVLMVLQLTAGLVAGRDRRIA
ncbi:CynX/NimT family MFS transporter [Actinoallomurus rhizosphaericola]|uniref:CynX/NimT family MFS transporter n=1 Tax=Actinoallomurus rhizosphaericola TaxID=2952536 RepID=UPI00209361F1|nr:MFS transporter [Actinoallomurus rhizosphaericola]MCO5997230.1 MFS transporter [Actinoallomurus rhizosphaericola]